MEMPVESAQRLVTNWTKEHESLLISGWWINEGIERNNSWNFQIRVNSPYGNQFILYTLAVTQGGTVSVVQDRLERVKKYLTSPEGFRREDLFFEEVNIQTAETPEWVVKTSRAPSSIDRRGIDGFLKIKIPDKGTIKLPIQIKSTKKSLEHHFLRYPEHRGVVMGVIMRDLASGEEIRKRLYLQANEMREKILNNSISYEAFKLRVTELCE